MIAKLFKRFSIYSVLISTLLLSLPAYIYSGLETKWVSFQDRAYTFLLIFGLLLLTLYSIRRIFKYSRPESRLHYYLLLYPLIVISFPYEYLDIRLLLCPTLLFTGWASYREYINARNSLSSKSSTTLLLDSVILVTFSSVIFYENIFLLIFPILGLLFSKKSISREEIGLIFIVPVILIFTSYHLLLLFDIQALFFSSILSEHYFSFSNIFNIAIFSDSRKLLLVFILFFLAVLLSIRKRLEYDAKTLEYDGLAYFVTIIIFIGFSRTNSGMQLHYLSLPLAYYINHLFILKRNPFIANFLFIFLIISFLLFTFVLN